MKSLSANVPFLSSYRILRVASIAFICLTSIVGIVTICRYFLQYSAWDLTILSEAGNSRSFRRGNGWGSIHIWHGGSTELKSATSPQTVEFQSQCGQDRFLVEEIFAVNPKRRFFIDLASNDAKYLSNSYALETFYNWNGLCIEANPRFFLGLSKRSCIAIGAVVNDKIDEEITFNLQPDFKDESSPLFPPHLFGGIVSAKTDNLERASNNVKFRTVTLAHLLERFQAPKVIDYLSLDVEGAESLVLSQFPFHRWQFLVLTIERPKEDLHQLLHKHGFWFLKLLSDWGETIYIHKSLPNFTPLMKKHRKNSSTKSSDKSKQTWDKDHSYLYDPQWSPSSI